MAFFNKTKKNLDQEKEIEKQLKLLDLDKPKCLEIGSCKGRLQNLAEDYTGIDITEKYRNHYTKPYHVVTTSDYPFDDDSFDVIWTFRVFEHIPDIQKAMEEIKRLLRPGGIVIFRPAWCCRPWAADGYPVRPYSDFGFLGKLNKMLIPLRNSLPWRITFLLPKRVYRHLQYLMGKRFEQLQFRKLKGFSDTYWMSDCDAVNDIDPHDAFFGLNRMDLKASLMKCTSLHSSPKEEY